jgi:hypothetical protein
MREVNLINRGGRYSIEDYGGEVTGIYDDPINAIEEWEYFEKLNTNRKPHRRFLNHVLTLEEIGEIVNKLKNDI